MILRELDVPSVVLTQLAAAYPERYSVLFDSAADGPLSRTSVLVAQPSGALWPDAGPATVRGYAVSGREQATRVAIRYPWPVEDPVLQQQGVSVRVAAMRLSENPALAGLKHCNRLEQVLARGGPVTRRLQTLLQPLLEEPADA